MSSVVSGAILFAFSISFVLSENGWNEAALYVDPIIVIGLVIASTSIPIKMLRKYYFKYYFLTRPKNRSNTLETRLIDVRHRQTQ